MARHIAIVTLGQHRNTARLWLQGQRLQDHAFAPGVRFACEADPVTRTVTITITERGAHRVSSKTAAYGACPIIDLNNGDLAAVFGQERTRLQATFEPGRIVVTIAPADRAARERLERVTAKLAAGIPLDMGSLFTGAGILDHAAHAGLEMAGIDTRLRWAVEVDERALDTAVRNNPVIRPDTLVVAASADTLVRGMLPVVDGLWAGIPCNGASLAGRAKNTQYAHAEEHPVGHLFVHFLMIVEQTQPAFIGIEQVAPYQTGPAIAAIRQSLTAMGYDVHETQLEGTALGALEARRRLCAIAVTRGLSFSWDGLAAVREKEATVAEVLDTTDPAVAPEHTFWSRFDHLVSKQERDHERYKAVGHGTGFKMQVQDLGATSVPTIPATYSRIQSTSPKLRHPTDPTLMRQYNPREHAAFKGIPFDLVSGECQSYQHRLLGQSVVHPAFVAVGRHLGFELRRDRSARAVAAPPASGDAGPGGRRRAPEQLTLFI